MAEAKEIEKEKEAKARVYHVSYAKNDSKWKIFLEKGTAIYKFDTKEAALQRVKELSKNQERSYIVHKMDGKVQKKR